MQLDSPRKTPAQFPVYWKDTGLKNRLTILKVDLCNFCFNPQSLIDDYLRKEEH